MHVASLQQAAALSASAGALVVIVTPGGAQGQRASRAADAQESAAARTLIQASSSCTPDLELCAEDLEGAMEQLERAVAARSPGVLHAPVLVLASTRRELTAALLARLVQERGSVFEALPQASGTAGAAPQARSQHAVHNGTRKGISV